MSGPVTTSITLPCDRSAPRLARRWVNEQLNAVGLDRHQHDGAVLLVNELVTDIVLGAGSEPVLWLQIEPDEIVLVVAAPESRDVDADDLDEAAEYRTRIVDEIADRWGERLQDDGTRVRWFALAKTA